MIYTSREGFGIIKLSGTEERDEMAIQEGERKGGRKREDGACTVIKPFSNED